jgi:hypothetical protein
VEFLIFMVIWINLLPEMSIRILFLALFRYSAIIQSLVLQNNCISLVHFLGRQGPFPPLAGVSTTALNDFGHWATSESPRTAVCRIPGA